jgi:hypothetical protein
MTSNRHLVHCRSFVRIGLLRLAAYFLHPSVAFRGLLEGTKSVAGSPQYLLRPSDVRSSKS